jgi:PAS domain S-box-containing protein
LDREWRFTNVNRQTEARLSIPREELIGRVFWEVFPQTIDSALYIRFHEAMERMEPAHFEVFSRIVPGAWFEAHAYPSRSGLTVYLREITERKRAERSSRLLASIVESSDDAIISKDLNGNISSWNRGAEHVFGYKADEVIGKPITILIPHQLYDEETEILARIRAGYSVDHYETVRLRKDGSLVDVSLTISPLKDESGRIVGASKIARDITLKKRSHEEKAGTRATGARRSGSRQSFERRVSRDVVTRAAQSTERRHRIFRASSAHRRRRERIRQPRR